MKPAASASSVPTIGPWVASSVMRPPPPTLSAQFWMCGSMAAAAAPSIDPSDMPDVSRCCSGRSSAVTPFHASAERSGFERSTFTSCAVSISAWRNWSRTAPTSSRLPKRSVDPLCAPVLSASPKPSGPLYVAPGDAGEVARLVDLPLGLRRPRAERDAVDRHDHPPRVAERVGDLEEVVARAAEAVLVDDRRVPARPAWAPSGPRRSPRSSRWAHRPPGRCSRSRRSRRSRVEVVVRAAVVVLEVVLRGEDARADDGDLVVRAHREGRVRVVRAVGELLGRVDDAEPRRRGSR